MQTRVYRKSFTHDWEKPVAVTNGPRRVWIVAASLAVVLLAMSLRLFHLSEQELWFDEVLSIHRATVDERILEALRSDDTPPFYYLLLRFWLSAAGISEFSVRLPSAIAGTLCVLAVIWAGRHMLSPAAGLWAGAFVAVCPIHIYYSQEARTYALLTLELALAYGLAWRAMRLNTWRAWVPVAVTALAALHSHYYTVLGLLPILFLPFAWPRDDDSSARRRRLLITALVTILLWVPWLLLAFYPYTHVVTLATTAWVAGLWEGTPPVLMMPKTMEVFTLGPQRDMTIMTMKQFVGLRFPDLLWWLGSTVMALLLAWAAIPWCDGAVKISWLGRRKLWVGSVVLTPLVILWVVSLKRPIYVLGRYDMVAFVGFALLVGFAIAKLQGIARTGPILAVLAAIGLSIPIGAKLALYYQAPATRYGAETAQALDDLVENGDVVILSQLRGLPQVLFYLPQRGYEWKDGTCRNAGRHREFTCRLFIPEASLQTSWDPQLTSDMARRFVETSVEAIKPGRSGLWAVVGDIRMPSATLVSYGIDNFVGKELLRAGFRFHPIEINGLTLLFRFTRDGDSP